VQPMAAMFISYGGYLGTARRRQSVFLSQPCCAAIFASSLSRTQTWPQTMREQAWRTSYWIVRSTGAASLSAMGTSAPIRNSLRWSFTTRLRLGQHLKEQLTRLRAELGRLQSELTSLRKVDALLRAQK
jgi:hypothetical protein